MEMITIILALAPISDIRNMEQNDAFGLVLILLVLAILGGALKQAISKEK